MKVTVPLPPRIKAWRCGNCGHNHDYSDDLKELGFYMTEQGVCITKCAACGGYCIAHRTGLHFGVFLVVTPHNKIRGKGANERTCK